MGFGDDDDHFAMLGVEAAVGVVIGTIVSGLFLLGYLYQLYVDNDRCTKCMRLCRRSKKLLGLAFLGSMAVLLSYTAMIFEQGFYFRIADGVLVFWARFVAYAISTSVLFRMLSHLLWTDNSSRFLVTLFGCAFWVVSGVFGTLSPSATHNWVYFGVGLAPMAAGIITLALASRRTDHVARGKLLWVTLGFAGFAIVWALSPAGANEINMEEATLGYAILEGLVFYLVYGTIICFYDPAGSAVAKGTVQRSRKAFGGGVRLTTPHGSATAHAAVFMGCNSCAHRRKMKQRQSTSGTDSTDENDSDSYSSA